MDATQYVTTQAGTGVAIRLPDAFNFKKGSEVWRLLHPEEWPYREYVLDFGEVSTISDCGIAWLRFFLGWAEAAQVSVRLSGVSEALAARLMEAEQAAAAGSARPARREGAGTSTASDLKRSPYVVPSPLAGKEKSNANALRDLAHDVPSPLAGEGEKRTWRRRERPRSASRPESSGASVPASGTTVMPLAARKLALSGTPSRTHRLPLP